ncbi:MAG TPA: hypothetical protein VFV66_24455 [Nonomuraea sp.]|nr:hypothetical protein [Nonomuraea sp.]
MIGWLKSLEAWGLLIGVTGIGLSVFLYARSFKKPAPKYHIEEIRLISSEDQILPRDVVIHYGDNKLDSLTKTIVTFWNDGRQTLGKEMIASSDPIVLSLKGGEGSILRIRTLRESRSVNQALMDPVDNRSARLEFEFFDPGDGVVVKVLHTGASSSATLFGHNQGSFGRPYRGKQRKLPSVVSD